MKINADKELIRKKVTAQILKNADLFSGLYPDELDLISSISKTNKFDKNEIIFKSGQIYSGFYYIADGIVKVYNTDSNGEMKVIHIFHKGEIFAEVPAFENPAEVCKNSVGYPASAVCMKNSSKIIHIPAKEFIDLIKNNSNISFRLLSGLSKNLKALQTRNFNLKFQDADRRLLHFLLTNIETKKDLFQYCNLGESDEIILKISKSDLASYIGTAQASLSRIFKKFSDLNLMKIGGKKITIINRIELMNYLNKV